MDKSILNHELEIREWLTYSLGLYRDKFWHVLGAILAVYIPINILTYLTGGYLLLWEFLFGTIASLAITFIVAGCIKGSDVDFRESLKSGLRRYVPALLSMLAYGLFVAALLVAGIVPGIIFFVYWIFVENIAALKPEIKPGKPVLEYSYMLVKGRWWKVLGYTLTAFLMALFVAVLLTIPFGEPKTFVITLITTTISAIIGSFIPVSTAVLFLNLDSITKKPSAKKILARRKKGKKRNR